MKSRRFTESELSARLASNPHLSIASESPLSTPTHPATPLEEPKAGKAPKRGKRRREMNATEREFSLYLQSLVDRGEILSFSYEGMMLRWGEGAGALAYSPDFVAVEGVEWRSNRQFIKLVFYEVKGSYAWQKDILRFKSARAHFPHFEFQLHEKGKMGWERTI